MADQEGAMQSMAHESNHDPDHQPPVRSGPRTRRRAGALLVVVGAAAIVFAILGNRWWSVEVGGRAGQAHVGLTAIELCVAERVPSCQRVADRRSAMAFALSLDIEPTEASLVELRDWFGSRRNLRWALWAAILVVAALAAISTGYWPHPHLRVAVLGAGAVVTLAGVFTVRFLWATPVANMYRDVHGQLAVAGLSTVTLGIALIASAVLRARPG